MNHSESFIFIFAVLLSVQECRRVLRRCKPALGALSDLRALDGMGHKEICLSN